MKDQYFQLSHLCLHAVAWENPESLTRPLIVLHGGWDDWYVIADLASRLAGQRSVYALELRGHGQSDKPETGYRLEDFALDVQGVVAQFPSTQVDIFGHSLGAVVALLVAVNSPDKIAHLIMEDPPFVLASEEEAYRTRMGELLILKHQPREAVQAVFETMFSRWGSALKEAAVHSFQNTADGFFRAQSPGGEQPMVEWPSLLAHLVTPTLALAGNPARGAWLANARKEMFIAAAPSARLIEFPDCGHYIHLEQSDKVVQIVENFLEK